MTSPAPAPKIDPSSLTLRAKPRRIVRFRRDVMMAGAAIAMVGIIACAWVGLSKPQAKPLEQASNVYTPDQRSDGKKAVPAPLQALPASYSDAVASSAVPQLGPPLPGDLGKPMLDYQRMHLTAGADATASPAMPSTPNPAQAAATSARQAGVFVQVADKTGGADPVAAPASAVTVVGPSAASALTLDLTKDQNTQGRKLDFIGKAAADDIYNSHTLQTPKSPNEILAGTVISASLITGLDSDLPGWVIAQVTENVYDTVSGHILLIPQGSRLIGQYDSVVAFGQSRALLVWQRIILPDGSSLQIDNLPATDTSGYVGLSDKVDYHTWALLKGVGLATLLGVTAVSGSSQDSDLVRAIRESAEQSVNQAGEKIVEKHLNIQPSITVRSGWPVRVIVHKDLILRPFGGS